MKAFIFDPLWDELATDEMLTALDKSGIETVVTKKVAPLADCEKLFAGSDERLLCINPDYVSWDLVADDYKGIPSLKGILIASTGFEWVDQSIANERNIPICQIVNFSTQAVAEWATLILFNLARRTPQLIKDGFPLDYEADFMKYRGTQLKGKTAGIIGLGNIGSAIAERCYGIGMNVIYWSQSSSNDRYQAATLEQLFASADVIFPTVAKNPETLKLITDDHLQSMQQSTIVVNIVHGLFNEQKVLDMVKSGELFGYGFEGKPDEFLTHTGNIWAAPAYAWTTAESMHNSTDFWVANMVSAAKGEFPHRIN